MERRRSTYQTNCLFCDTSTKFDRYVDRYIGNKIGYWALANAHPGGRGIHLLKVNEITCNNGHNWDPKYPDIEIAFQSQFYGILKSNLSFHYIII